MAAFMACAHAKFTGEVGVCLATSGPGAIHLLNGLYDAKMDHQPVVAIVGQQATIALGADFQQEIDLITLFKDVAHEYIHMATDPEQIRHLVDRAMRIAKAERTVTCVILPNDVQEMDAVRPAAHARGDLLGSGLFPAARGPHEEDLRRAAEVLNGGKKVAMLVGAGASAADEVMEAADLLGAGVAKALLGKAALPDDLPFVTGAIGLLGTKPSWDLMTDCDTLLMVGTSFPYSEFLPGEGQARAVRSISPRMLGIRYPTEVNLWATARDPSSAHPAAEAEGRPLLAGGNRKGSQGMVEGAEARAMEAPTPSIPSASSGSYPPAARQLHYHLRFRSSANWFARDLKIREGMIASLSGNLATMGPGVPYAIAAKFAYPDRVVALVGDGAMQMNGNNGLITIAKHWKNGMTRLMMLVLNNRDLNQVTWEQRVMSGDPKFEGSQNVPDFPFAAYAEMLGLRSVPVNMPET